MMQETDNQPTNTPVVFAGSLLTGSLAMVSSKMCELPQRPYSLKSKGETHVLYLEKIFIETSVSQAELDDALFEPLHRTLVMIETNLGSVDIFINRELLVPGAQHYIDQEPWSYLVKAENLAGEKFQDHKLLFNLPEFDERTPNPADFEKLFDPQVDTELNILRIVSKVCVECFLKITDAEVQVSMGSGERALLFTLAASGDGKYLLPSDS